MRNLLTDQSNTCFAHAINICEVFYDAFRAGGNSAAEEVIEQLINDGVVIREDLNRVFWSDIGRLKVNPGKISLADCAAIALARAEKCELVTCDHHEMDVLVGTGIVDLLFIR